MRAPVRKVSQTIISFINLVLATYDGSRSGYALEKHIKKRGVDGAVLQQKRRHSKMQVMLCGRVEPPKLVCCRELKDIATNNNVVPIALKKNQACQKYAYLKILFCAGTGFRSRTTGRRIWKWTSAS